MTTRTAPALNADHARLRSIYSRAKAMHDTGASIFEDDDGTLRDEIRELAGRLPAHVSAPARAAFSKVGF